MTLLELGKFYPPYRGGMETLLRLWCEGFVRRGAEVNCVVAHTAARTTRDTLAGVHVHRLASFGQCLSVSLCPRYPFATRAFPADLWHVHFPNPLADLACLLGPARTPLVVSYHSDIVRQTRWLALYHPLLDRFLRRADRIVVATPQHLEFSPTLQPYRSKCEVIPFGIDLKPFCLDDAGRAEVAQLRSSSGGRTIALTVGRLVEYKGHRYLLEAIRGTDLCLWVVGQGPLASDLSRRAAELGLRDQVRFWGEVDDAKLTRLLHACDIFVLASVTPNEAFGLVLVEAMACGKPLITTDLPSGIRYANRGGETGLVVPPRDIPALQMALNKLAHSADERARMGACARKRAETEFEQERMVQRYWDSFAALLAGRRNT